MSDIVTEIAPEPSSNGHVIADLERRVLILEAKVAQLPDSHQIEERVTERVKASIPRPAQPVDPSQTPGFRDIEIPIPSVQNVVSAAKTGWALWEMFGEIKALFWTLFDRRYHMAWLTRFITIGLLVMIADVRLLVPAGDLRQHLQPPVGQGRQCAALPDHVHGAEPRDAPLQGVARRATLMVRLGVNIDHVATLRQAPRRAAPGA